MDKKCKRSVALYPFYGGFGVDLLFYVAVDTLFLTTVKRFTESQFLTLAAIATTVSLALRLPLLWLARKIGNTMTLRLGAACLLLGAIMITFGQNFATIAVGRSLRFVNALATDICLVATLENNLARLDREEEFLPIRARGSTFYSALTLVISLVASTMFNIDPYFPMYCCIAGAAIAFVISLLSGDYSGEAPEKKQTKAQKKPFRLPLFLLLALLSYGILFAAISNNIGDNKLFMQQEFLKTVDLQRTATLIGGIYFLSRLARLLSNVFFVRLFRKLKMKTGFAVWFTALTGFALIIAGAFLRGFWTKVAVMGSGYVAVLLACDPVKLYIQQVIVLYTPREKHRTLFAYMGLAFSIFTALNSVLSPVALELFSMVIIPVLLLSMTVISVLVLVVLYKQLQKRTPVISVP